MAQAMIDTQATEEPVWLDGASGRLFGILHRPSSYRDPSVFVLMLNSGMQNRSGPQRLYVNAARQFAEAGISVLRLDLAGVGDSLAENVETHFDGHRPGDVASAIDYVVSQFRPQALLLQGLCAGSRVAIKAAASDSRVDGVLAWSTTIFTAAQNMPQSPEEPKDRLSKAVVTKNRQRMRDFIFKFKLFRPSWWKKRLFGDKSLHGEISEFALTLLRLLQLSGTSRSKTPFFSAIDAYLDAGRKVIFVYGDHDRIPLQEFRDRFPSISPDSGDLQCYAIVNNGSHTFSSIGTQQMAIDLSMSWVDRHFGETQGNSIDSGKAHLKHE